MEKLITVIVPVYNGEKYIAIFVENIVLQTYFKYLNIIFVDDGSTDASRALLRDYQVKYSDHMRIIQKSNGGVSSARNAGLQAVETEYFTFADIDDVMHPSLFEAMYQQLHVSDAELVCTSIKKIRPEEVASIVHDPPKQPAKEILRYSGKDAIRQLLLDPLWNSAYGKLYKSKKLGHIRFDEQLAIAEDKLYTFQCFSNSKLILRIPEGICYYYVRQPNSAMSYSNARNKLGTDIVLDRIQRNIAGHYPELLPLACARKAEIHAAAYVKAYLNEKDYRGRTAIYLDSVKKCPLKYAAIYMNGRGRLKFLIVRFIRFILLPGRIANRRNLL